MWLKQKVLVCTIDASVGKYLFFLFSIITSTTFTGCWKLLLKKKKMKNDQRKVNFTLPRPICLSVEADLHQLASSLGRTRRREGDWQRTTKAFQHKCSYHLVILLWMPPFLSCKIAFFLFFLSQKLVVSWQRLLIRIYVSCTRYTHSKVSNNGGTTIIYFERKIGQKWPILCNKLKWKISKPKNTYLLL